MTSTVFQDAVPATPITASWLNDVNNHVYGAGQADTLTQTATAFWFQADGAKINRHNDRAFIGGATVNDANHPNVAQDWLTQFQISTGRTLGFVEFAQCAVLTTDHPYSSTALIAGARTSKRTGAGNGIPITAIGVNDCTAYATNAYGLYSEAYNMAGALGAAFGMEIDTVNYRGAATISPYAQHNQEVIGLQLAAGAELSSTGQYASSAAINIQNNNSTFERGIVFGSSAISGATGTSGTGIAIAFGQGHTMQWYGSTTAPTSSISCTVPAANSSTATAIEFASVGMRVKMANGGQGIATFIPVANAANYLQFVPATAGNSVQIQAQGSDANVHLSLVPKGTGLVQFGNVVGGATACVGYITILDASGVQRKLLIG